MAVVAKFGGVDMANLAKIMGLDVPSGALVEDVLDTDIDPTTSDTSTSGWYRKTESVPENGDLDLCTKVMTFAADSRAVAVGSVMTGSGSTDRHKLRLIMDGVQVVETGYLPFSGATVVVGSKALSGSKTIILRIHNYGVTINYTHAAVSATGSLVGGMLGVGSLKT